MKDPLSETRLDFTEKIAVRDDRQRTGMAPGKLLPVITNRRARRSTTKDENQVRCTYKIFEAKFVSSQKVGANPRGCPPGQGHLQVPVGESPPLPQDIEKMPKFVHQCVSTAPGAPGRTRTCDTRFRKPLLYPLSYGGST
jgi:hypothetical protein